MTLQTKRHAHNSTVWRQKSTSAPGKLVACQLADLNPDMSFLEVLNVLNGQLTQCDKDPVVPDHDCWGGICGSCALFASGRPYRLKLLSANRTWVASASAKRL